MKDAQNFATPFMYPKPIQKRNNCQRHFFQENDPPTVYVIFLATQGHCSGSDDTSFPQRLEKPALLLLFSHFVSSSLLRLCRKVSQDMLIQKYYLRNRRNFFITMVLFFFLHKHVNNRFKRKGVQKWKMYFLNVCLDAKLLKRITFFLNAQA